MKILIVDDNLEMLSVICSSLLDFEYQTLPARSSRQGLGIAFAKKPDLILVDLLMPEIDGYEFSELLKLNPETSDIPVVIMTYDPELIDKIKIKKAGITDWIKKPIISNELIKWISNFIKRKEFRTIETTSNID